MQFFCSIKFNLWSIISFEFSTAKKIVQYFNNEKIVIQINT